MIGITKQFYKLQLSKYVKVKKKRQPNYSLANRAIEKELQVMCGDQGIGRVRYSPIGGGILQANTRRSFRRAAVGRMSRLEVVRGFPAG
ncbi:aldo/keto reductase [Paenibacillus cremeus]|uniref:NADP-dependent oxidoreductase domain-containing protein n=1 Tax=Paenibacillus cremeus TaxID=2163881 RepID=A0A559JVP7_9BACL|nr:aldo/keto reductase [Paenibacillus cremeus]TVY03956.1 hypothetical protein FPZ49_31005 [Paenibacillus cremeus]